MSEPAVYQVTGVITISVSTEVIATSEREAKMIAEERGLQSLCHQCAEGDYAREWSLSGELDGEVEIDSVENLRDLSPTETRRYYGAKGR